MIPLRLVCRPDRLDPAAFAEVSAAIARGDLIAYPTDTFYGLGADPRQAAAVARLFDAKGRAGAQAIPLIAAEVEDVERWFGPLAPRTARLAAAFWPGPLTLVIPLRETILPAELTGGGDSIAVRVPDHAIARAVAAAAGGLITSTSANRSGQPPKQHARDVLAEVGASLALIVDAGPTPASAPSTIVDVRDEQAPPRLIRTGVVPWRRVLESLQ